jgi:crotonobetainyl-CoA:carnitine CoA-transferase CaiB-like acyl-CoA transferase
MTADGMLAGVRVLDFAGPTLEYAGRMFADLGADVILVEPLGGVPARAQHPLVPTSDGAIVSSHFAYMAAGKQSVAVDITTERGRSILEQLVAVSDVALLPSEVDDQRAFGLEPARMQALNDRLVAISVTGFGNSGPRRHWRSSDLVGWATSGALFNFGEPDRAPLAPGGGLGYAACSLNGAMAAMVALRARRRSGKGQIADISVQEAVMSVTMEAGPLLTLEDRPQKRTGPLRAGPHGIFPTKDGSVEIVAVLPMQWANMATWISEELGIEEATSDALQSPMARFELRELIEVWVCELASRYTKQEFFLEAQRRHIPCGPINTATDLLTDPQLEAVGAWQDVEHPDTTTLRVPRSPVRFDGVPTTVGAVPGIGEHTAEVLRTVLGVSDADVAELAATGVIGIPTAP